MVLRCLAAYLFGLFIAAPALAGECLRDSDGAVVCGRGSCMIDWYGKLYCSREGGGAMRDQNGNVVCGVGYCASDDTGRVMCSTLPGGGVARDWYGKVKCEGGCFEGTPQLCEVAR